MRSQVIRWIVRGMSYSPPVRSVAEKLPAFFAFSFLKNTSRICTICLRFGGSFSTLLNRRQRLVSPSNYCLIFSQVR